MKFRTEFKDTMDKARYLAKLIRLLPTAGCEDKWRDVGDYRVKYYDRKIRVYIDSGEEMEIAWSGGALHDFWGFVLDRLLEDVQKEIEDNIEIINSLGLQGKGLFPVK